VRWYAHGALRLVDVLAAGAAGPVPRTMSQVALGLDARLSASLGLGQDGHRGGRGATAALGSVAGTRWTRGDGNCSSFSYVLLYTLNQEYNNAIADFEFAKTIDPNNELIDSNLAYAFLNNKEISKIYRLVSISNL
jgi:hypothetical protein